jgi:hypothetical protein
MDVDVEAKAREVSRQYWRRALDERQFEGLEPRMDELIYKAISRAFRDFADELVK